MVIIRMPPDYDRSIKFWSTTKQDHIALAPFINQWISVEETIDYRTSGAYSIVLKVSATEEVLFSYSNDAKINWRPEAEFVRPKWGIYRSLLYPEDIRDETLLFADFSIAENNLFSLPLLVIATRL